MHLEGVKKKDKSGKKSYCTEARPCSAGVFFPIDISILSASTFAWDCKTKNHHSHEYLQEIKLKVYSTAQK